MAIENDARGKGDCTTSTSMVAVKLSVDNNASTSASNSANAFSSPHPPAPSSAGVVMAFKHQLQQSLPPPHLQPPHTITSSLSSITLTTTSCVPVCSTGGITTTDYHHRYHGLEADMYTDGKSNNINNNCFVSGVSNNNGEIVNVGVFSGLTNSATSNKSETSSIDSVNGSIKKTSSSNALVNSREDVTSLGGASSITSHQSTSSSYNKGAKDIAIQNYCNGRLSRELKENDEDNGLGPLPLKWETAYTERGELYFIDHNTGTSHWLDPRLSKFQKKSLEDCGDDELPYGWEKIEDALYGTYYIDHVNRRTQYENPVLEAKRRAAEQTNQEQLDVSDLVQPKENSSILPYKFTKNPLEMQGERITTTLLKSSRGLGITIVGGDDTVEEFLQIKSIVPNGPAWLDGQLQTGDILVYVNDTCVLGFTHHEMVNVFQSILPGETVTLEVCRGYPLPFDPNDPNTEVVTTIAVDGISSSAEKNQMLMNLNMDGNYNFLEISDSTDADGINQSMDKLCPGISNESNEKYVNDDFILLKKPEFLSLTISKGGMGFGFTIADSANGQKVKKILDRNCCKNLQEGDILLEINNSPVNHMTHCEVVRVLKDCPKTESTTVKIQRGNTINISNVSGRTSVNSGKFKKADESNRKTLESGMFRSKTPNAELYSTQTKEILPIRPKTPLVDTRRARVKTPSHEFNEEIDAVTNRLEKQSEDNKSVGGDAKSTNSLQEIDSIKNDIPFMDPYPKLVTSLSERLAEASLINENHNNIYHMDPTTMLPKADGYENTITSPNFGYNSLYAGVPVQGEFYEDNRAAQQNMYSPSMAIMAPVPTYHQDNCYCYDCQDYQRYKFHHGFYHTHQNSQNGRIQKRVTELVNDRRKTGFSSLESHCPLLSEQHHQQPRQSYLQVPQQMWNYMEEFELSEVTLERQAQGFGFRIVGGTEEGSQVTVGHVVPGGAADGDPGMATGDEILSIDGVNVVKSSHHKVVSLMGEAALRGQVTMILRRRVKHAPAPISVRPIRYPYDVIVSRHESEGFGFVIISSSNQYYGSTIGKLIPGSPAVRCGDLKVGDRIIAVNNIDIAGMSHGDVVNLIKESGLHVRLTIGSPKEDTPILNAPQSSPVLPQLKSETPTYFDRAHKSQLPQL